MRTHVDSSRLLLRPVEAAESLGVSLRTLMAWVAAGQIPVVRCGLRCLRFSTADLDSWIRERSTRPVPPATGLSAGSKADADGGRGVPQGTGA